MNIFTVFGLWWDSYNKKESISILWKYLSFLMTPQTLLIADGIQCTQNID